MDHIIPLGGNDVCGLHVLANLQYLPPADNYRKGNRLNSSLTEGTPRGQSTKEE